MINHHHFSFNLDNTTNSLNFLNDLKDCNDFLSLKDNLLDFSFLPISKNELNEIEINENNILKKDDADKTINLNDKKCKERVKKDKKLIFFLSQRNHESVNDKYGKNIIYRKDAYYKHFKSIFAKYIKNKANNFKNICFPHFDKNNFSALAYKYTGNPKEKDNYKFLSFTIKDLLSLGKNEKIKNRQYNNLLLINYIEKNKIIAKNKNVYMELMKFLNSTVEKELINFYQDKEQFENINKDSKCLFFDTHFKKQTGISLLEKNGFIKVLRNQI